MTDEEIARLNEAQAVMAQINEHQQAVLKLQAHWREHLKPELAKLAPWRVGDVLEYGGAQWIVMAVWPVQPGPTATTLQWQYNIAPRKKNGEASVRGHEWIYPGFAHRYTKVDGAQ